MDLELKARLELEFQQVQSEVEARQQVVARLQRDETSLRGVDDNLRREKVLLLNLWLF